ncbi:MAG: TusE/DsrC/DsvC family sulfur relay protein [Proteobacteria bacterium]|nr:TusE/DsrC/DsvC family sulfur relay protein [Pseudomonadota bacterium]
MDIDQIARLEAIDKKLDYIVERQQYTEDFIREMTPVGREAITALAARLAVWEERGLFAIGTELLGLVDKLADHYGPEDVRELSGSVVAILDTVRNVTQPDVLEFANEATDVLHDADKVKPVGPMGAAAAVRDVEVQRGLGVALEILRHLGRSHGNGQKPQVRRPTTSAGDTVSSSSKTSPEPTKCPPTEVVVWEGHRFTADGFLLDTAVWDDALAIKMAAGLGIDLTDDHWAVVRWARQDYLTTGASPNVRRMASGSGVGIRQMYALFPKTPGKAAAMVAGIPKPAGCV